MKNKIPYIVLLLLVAVSVFGQYGRNYPMGPWHHNITYGWGNYVLWLIVIALVIAVIYLIVQMSKLKKQLGNTNRE